MNSNNQIAFIYCIVAAVSACILIYNAKTVSDITSRSSKGRYVFYAGLFAGLASIFDCAYILRESGTVEFAQPVSYILTLVYVISLSLCGMFWVCYSETMQNAWVVKTKKRFFFYALPLLLSLVIMLLTPFTHWYFYFEGSHYQRGPLFLALSTLLFLYVVQSGITALVRSFKKKNYVDRKEYRRLFAFAAVYMVIQIVQLALPAIFPYRSVGMMIFFEIVLIQNLKEMIGIDPLTRLKNRFAAERKLGEMFGGNGRFELLGIDVDKFKSINDQYGHLEGDNTLRYIAMALQNSVDNSCFVARMGGDEFIIINENLNCSIENIEGTINDNLAVILKKYKCEYTVTVSVGYTLKGDGVKSIPDLIALADGNMYSRKEQKKIIK